MFSQVHFNYPRNFEASDRSIFYFVDEREILPQTVVEEETGAFDIVNSKNKSKGWLFSQCLSVLFGRKKLRLVEIGAWVTDQYSNNYFHWFNDVLPKLILLEELGIKCPVILPQKIADQKYVLESLNLVGWKCEGISLNTICFFKKLYLPSATAGSGSQHPKYFGQVVDRLRMIGNKPNRKIYVSRRDSPFRNVRPEEKFEELLQKAGFEIVSLNGKSLQEQLELFSECSHLVAVHGAALTNMAFMQPGTKVLEIRRRDDKLNYCYFKMASVLNHKYYYFLADGEDFLKPVQSDNFLINIDRFSSTLQQFLLAEEEGIANGTPIIS